MRRTFIIPLFAVIAIVAILTMPGIAKISGQHAFIEGEAVQCETCHKGIEEQLKASSAHAGKLNDGSAWALDCKACHDVRFVTGERAHASTTISCSECHNKTGKDFWHNDITVEGIGAKDFFKGRCDEFSENLNNDCGIQCHSGWYPQRTPEDELAFDSHVEFYEGAIASDVLLHADEACIMCHTEAQKQITMLEHTLIYNAETNTFTTEPYHPEQ